jgi:hypothetical protein
MGHRFRLILESITITSLVGCPNTQRIPLAPQYFPVQGRKTEFRPLGPLVYSVFSRKGYSLGAFNRLGDAVQVLRKKAGRTLAVSIDYRPAREFWHVARIQVAEFERREIDGLVIADDAGEVIAEVA